MPQALEGARRERPHALVIFDEKDGTDRPAVDGGIRWHRVVRPCGRRQESGRALPAAQGEQLLREACGSISGVLAADSLTEAVGDYRVLFT